MPTQSRITILLATDQQQSVLNARDSGRAHPLSYTPYGHRPLVSCLLSLPGFNGQPPDPETGHYHLGNGYRQFNPVLMRFHCPDSWSPFEEGGLNAYGYCLGNPITGSDSTGHTPVFIKSALRGLGLMKQSAAKGAQNISQTVASRAGASIASQVPEVSNAGTLIGSGSNLVGTYKPGQAYQRLGGIDYNIYIKPFKSSKGYDNIKIKAAARRPESTLPNLTLSDFHKLRSSTKGKNIGEPAALERRLMETVSGRFDQSSPEFSALQKKFQMSLNQESTSTRENVMFKKVAGGVREIRR
jgi:RHS repeat-associated protein